MQHRQYLSLHSALTDPPKKKLSLLEEMKNNIQPQVEQDATRVVKTSPNPQGFNEYLTKQFGVNDDQMTKLLDFVPKIKEEEINNISGTERAVRRVVGVRAADYLADKWNSNTSGEETSKGVYNIHDSAIAFLPQEYKGLPQAEKARAILVKNFYEAKNKGLDDEAAYRVAASAYNKGMDNAMGDEQRGETSKYGRRVSGTTASKPPTLEELKENIEPRIEQDATKMQPSRYLGVTAAKFLSR